jgi:hypothetical protein
MRGELPIKPGYAMAHSNSFNATYPPVNGGITAATNRLLAGTKQGVGFPADWMVRVWSFWNYDFSNSRNWDDASVRTSGTRSRMRAIMRSGPAARRIHRGWLPEMFSNVCHTQFRVTNRKS